MRGLAAILTLALATTATATGPSRATVEIIPIAVSAKGVVLFKTWRELSPMGSPAAQRTEVGWLVVSGDGLWREIPHAVFDPTTEKTDAQWVRLLEQFRAEFDWKRPPPSARPLLKEFGLTAANRVAPDSGKGSVTWTPERICLGPSCLEFAVSQWAPGGTINEPAKGNPIASSFYAAGVALFRCEGGDKFATKEQAGAVFALPPNRRWDEREGLVDIGYDVQEIDGISVLPKALRGDSALDNR